MGYNCYFSVSDTFNQHFISSGTHLIFRFQLHVVIKKVLTKCFVASQIFDFYLFSYFKMQKAKSNLKDSDSGNNFNTGFGFDNPNPNFSEKRDGCYF